MKVQETHLVRRSEQTPAVAEKQTPKPKRKGQFVKGDPRCWRLGRPKGCKDKTTRLREAILDVCFSPVSKDDKRTYIRALADKHPAAFARLVAKILPAEVKVDAAVDLSAAMQDMSDEELARLAHATG